MNPKNCPKCKTKGSIRKILWGMPDPDNPDDSDKYIVGGCLVTGFDPTHECIKCGWQRMPKRFEFAGNPGSSGIDAAQSY